MSDLETQLRLMRHAAVIEHARALVLGVRYDLRAAWHETPEGDPKNDSRSAMIDSADNIVRTLERLAEGLADEEPGP